MPDRGEGCTCLSMSEIAKAELHGGVQSREPCPVHGEPEIPPGTFVERIQIPEGTTFQIEPQPRDLGDTHG